MKRTPDDICLLCQSRKSVKTNSHIIPKFFANSFLMDNGKASGYKYTAKKIYNNVQDSPKEDYLFCNECEEYFNFIERPASHFLRNFHTDNITSSQQIFVNQFGSFVESRFSFNPIIFHLFFYSIMFRVSVSNDEVFASYFLDRKDEEHLRIQLMKYFAIDNFIFESKLNQNRIEMLDYILFTCANFPTDTFGGITAISSKKGHLLCANKFLIYTSETKDDKEDDSWNQDKDVNKITYCSFTEYEKSFLIPIFKKMRTS